MCVCVPRCVCVCVCVCVHVCVCVCLCVCVCVCVCVHACVCVCLGGERECLGVCLSFRLLQSQPRAKLCRSSTSSISSSCWYCVHCTASSEPSSGVGASCDIVHLGASENLDDVHDVWHTRHVPRETLLMPHRRRRAAASARPRRCAADALSVQHPPPQYRNPPPFSASYKRDEMDILILQPP